LRHSLTLNPHSARQLMSKKMQEDHMFRSSYDPAPSLTPRTQGAKMKFQIRTGDSSYRAFYGPDYNCGAEPKVSHLMKPLEMGQAFASFPAQTEPLECPVSPIIQRQAVLNTQYGKAYRDIFESPTCL
jgi:hypothetical protein